MVKFFLFDIGNVLVEWDPRFLYEKLIEDKVELDRFLSDIVTLEWHSEHDRGRPFAAGVAQLSARFPAYAPLIEAFDTRWSETIKGPIEGMVTLLHRLDRAGFPLYALTNFSAEKFPLFKEEYDFTDIFQDIIVSGEEKLIKPDPRIYQLSLERIGRAARDILFIDDRLENVEAAEKAGMKGHHFTGADTFEQFLKAEGLLYAG